MKEKNEANSFSMSNSHLGDVVKKVLNISNQNLGQESLRQIYEQESSQKVNFSRKLETTNGSPNSLLLKELINKINNLQLLKLEKKEAFSNG